MSGKDELVIDLDPTGSIRGELFRKTIYALRPREAAAFRKIFINDLDFAKLSRKQRIIVFNMLIAYPGRYKDDEGDNWPTSTEFAPD